MNFPRVVGSLGMALGLAVAGWVADGVGAAPTSQQAVTVEMRGDPDVFVPANLTVPVGTTVTWVTTSDSHTVRSESGILDSGPSRLQVGQSYSFTFTEPGVYAYYCGPHRAQGMVGQVVVLGTGKGAMP